MNQKVLTEIEHVGYRQNRWRVSRDSFWVAAGGLPVRRVVCKARAPKLCAMSWQQYVDDQLIGTKIIDEACLAGHDGVIWATSPGLGAQPDQIKTLVQAMDNSDVVTTNGFSIGDMKYVYLSSIPGKVIRGKAKGRKSGVHVCLTKQAIIVGRYSDPVTGGEAAKVVENLGDYLTGVGY